MPRKKKYQNKNNKTLNNLVTILNNYYDSLNDSQDSNLEEFKNEMVSLRKFLQDSLSVNNGYTTAFNHLIQNSSEYLKFKIMFTHSENFYERIIELDENEKVISDFNNEISINNLETYLTNEFNKLFLKDVQIEISKLDKYINSCNTFVMVGCGCLPITLLEFCEKYKNVSFIGIDNSSEAIRKAINLKEKFKTNNLSFNIVDGLNYDYKDTDVVFVANTVVPKNDVLRQIAMSAYSKTRIIIRVPVLSGNLLSEDVKYNCIPRIKLLEEFSSDSPTDDLLYKLLVLEIR